ncbi:AraC-like DNA-binding protein [Salibacterium salarium]|uniref:AraC family transcriptional regulator n=1 Tax=Salibacterium salarium TaxID=284579 RepID=UPI002789DB0D|nr:helix-turn-helix domain-containing protein [Salibacterium salarium]MDQ0297975.1 AraC-like DNA-binding protein [Salibacterium salarium]
MRGRSLLTKLIIFGCIISIVPVLFVGIFSYVQSSKQMQEKVNNEKMQMTRQINANVEQVLLMIDHSMDNAIDNSLMDEAIRSPMLGGDFIIYREFTESIRKLHSYKTKVEEIIVLNFTEDWIINNKGVHRLSNHPDEEKYLSYLDLEYDSSWELLEQENFSEALSYSGCENSISLIKKIPAKRSPKDGIALAKIPTCSLAEMTNMDDLTDEVMIVDEEYRIMVHSNPSMIGKSLDETGHVENLDGFSGEHGQFNTRSMEEPHTVTYHTSEFNNWTYLSFHSIDKMTEESKSIGWITFLIISFIIILCLTCVFIVSRKLYFPVNKLVTSIEDNWPKQSSKKKNELQLIEEHITDMYSSQSSLEQKLHDHTQQLQSLFINRLFLGNYKMSEINDKLEYFNLSHLIEKWDQMMVLTLQIDTLKNQPRDLELLFFAVHNILNDSISKENKLPSVWIDQTLVTLVGFSEKKNLQQEVYNITESIQDNIQQTLKVSISIGISLPFTEIKKASRGYLEGIEVLKHRIKLGKGVIIHYNSIHSEKHSIMFNYPERTEKELFDAIKMAEEVKAMDLLQKWVEKAFKNPQSPREYQISMMRLLNNLLIVKQENGISFQQMDLFNASVYEEVLTLQTKDEVENWFKERLVHPLIKVFRARKESQFQNLSEKIIDIIHKNYETDVSLEDCASKLHYNANYLSNVFKQETKYTFSEYLVMYRFSQAKKWLLETDMTIKEIAEKLRYKNSQNFIRSFKKQEDMTPGRYRQKYRDVS